MNRKLDEFRRRIVKANLLFRMEVHSTQWRCKHKHLSEHVDGLPPMRVCRNCGMSEIGWGPGYVVLKGEAVKLSRDEVHALRAGLYITGEDKEALLRGEVTVRDLLTRIKP